MKKISNILMLLAMSLMTMAQQQVAQQGELPCDWWMEGYPDHFCDCRAGTPFQYPFELEISDTVWFSSTVDDLKLGLSAYWIANSSVTFEVYAFCSSLTPTIKLTVGSNQMKEMTIDEINAKLDQMGGSSMSGVISTLVPRIKVYPNGGTGKVYCYPYDEGPKSTCDSTLRFFPGMTFVCSQAEEVYKLYPGNISTKGEGFIRWKQKDNLPGTIRLTKDSCNGEEIANVTLRDSMHVYMLDTTQMKAIKAAKDTIYVHVTHDSSYVGRVVYRNSIKWDDQQIDTTICQGKGLVLPDTTLMQSTVYPNDILYKKADTLAVTTYHLTVEEPEVLYDTLNYKAAQLPTTYRNQYIPKNGWGDYEFMIHQSNRCDDIVRLHVAHDTVRREIEVNDTLCVGRTITYSGVTYSQDTVIRDSIWEDADTWVVRDITIHFTEPELEFDTIAIPMEWLTPSGYWYSVYGILITDFCDTLITKTKKNTCTRLIQLHIKQRSIGVGIDEVPISDMPTVKYLRDGVIYIRREGHEYDLLGRPVK